MEKREGETDQGEREANQERRMRKPTEVAAKDKDRCCATRVGLIDHSTCSRDGVTQINSK